MLARSVGGVHHERVDRLAQVVSIRLEHPLQLLVAALVVLKDGAQHVVRTHLGRVWGQEVCSTSRVGCRVADIAVAGAAARIVVDQPVNRIAAVVPVILRRRGGVAELVRTETWAVRDGWCCHGQTRGRPGRGKRRDRRGRLGSSECGGQAGWGGGGRTRGSGRGARALHPRRRRTRPDDTGGT